MKLKVFFVILHPQFAYPNESNYFVVNQFINA
jgi:hypothetical protein